MSKRTEIQAGLADYADELAAAEEAYNEPCDCCCCTGVGH